jgi:stress response protein YsnF
LEHTDGTECEANFRQSPALGWRSRRRDSDAALQEELEVGVKTTETGAVRIHKIVHEKMQPIPVSLRSQTVEVKRFTVNRPVEHKFERGTTLQEASPTFLNVCSAMMMRPKK